MTKLSSYHNNYCTTIFFLNLYIKVVFCSLQRTGGGRTADLSLPILLLCWQQQRGKKTGVVVSWINKIFSIFIDHIQQIKTNENVQREPEAGVWIVPAVPQQGPGRGAGDWGGYQGGVSTYFRHHTKGVITILRNTMQCLKKVTNTLKFGSLYVCLQNHYLCVVWWAMLLKSHWLVSQLQVET